MSITDANPLHPTFIDDYVLREVDLDWMAKAVKLKQFIHIDQAECIMCEGCVDICPWKCIHMVRPDAIAEAVDSCGRVVVTEESPQTGGFGGEVVATVVEESFWSLEAPVVRVSGFDVPYPVGMVEDSYVPDEDRIAAAVRRVLEVA